MGSLAWDLWRGFLWLWTCGFGSSALNFWLGSFDFGSLALDLWLGIFGLDPWVGILGLGNWDPEAGGTSGSELREPNQATASHSALRH